MVEVSRADRAPVFDEPIIPAVGARSSGFLQRHRLGGCARLFCGEGAAGELHHVIDGIEFLQLGGAEVAEEDGVGFGPEQGSVLLADLTGMDSHTHLLLGMVVVERHQLQLIRRMRVVGSL